MHHQHPAQRLATWLITHTCLRLVTCLRENPCLPGHTVAVCLAAGGAARLSAWQGPVDSPSPLLHICPRASPGRFLATYPPAFFSCLLQADLEADAQSAALYQARLDWILLGPARTPEGNTPAGLNNEAS